MNQNYELPHDVDAEKELLSALLVKNAEKIPAVAAIVSVDDFYRPEHESFSASSWSYTRRERHRTFFQSFRKCRKRKVRIANQTNSALMIPFAS